MGSAPTQSNTFYHLPQNGCIDKEDVVDKHNLFIVFVLPYACRCRQSKRLFINSLPPHLNNRLECSCYCGSHGQCTIDLVMKRADF